MADRVLITMEDLEAAVRANAAFEGAGYKTTMVSALDDLRAAIRRAHPELIVLTGGLREAGLPRAPQAGEAPRNQPAERNAQRQVDQQKRD